MDARNLSQLERLFSMLWNRDNQEVRGEMEKLRLKKVSRESFARKFFDTEGEENLLLFLNLIEINDEWALMIVKDMVGHSPKVTPHDATIEAIDLIADYRKV